MSIAFVVVIVALLAAISTLMFEARAHSGADVVDPADPSESKQWLVRKLADRPRLARLAHRRLDRSTAGGFLVTAVFVLLFATALLVGLLFDLADNDNGLAGLDLWVATWGSSHSGDASTRYLGWLTEFGSTVVGLGVLSIAATIDFVRHRNRNVFTFAALVGIGQWLLINGLKLLVRRERPDLLQLVGSTGYSFPSGHSATAAACWAGVAFILARRSPKPIRSMAGGLAVLVATGVATSRALLGVHWLSDVIAGTTIGWGWTWLLVLVFSREMRPLAPLVVEVVAEADEESTTPHEDAVLDEPAAKNRPTIGDRS